MIHIIYTGKEGGGAQNFAISLAKKTACITCTVRHGGFKDRLHRAGLEGASGFWVCVYRCLTESKVVLSDLRVLLLFAPLIFFRAVLGKGASTFFVPHSDKLINYRKIILAVCRVSEIVILPTTRSQRDGLREKFWFRIFDDLNISSSNHTKKKELIYFGRFAKVKNLEFLITTFERSGLNECGWKLTLIGGDGFRERDANIINWLSQDALQKYLCEGAVVLNASPTEGISLQVLEGIEQGLYPVVFSSSLAYNLGLNADQHVFSDWKSLRRIILGLGKFDPEVFAEHLNGDSKSILDVLK